MTTTTTSSISEAISQWSVTMIDHLFVFILGCAAGRSPFRARFYLEIVEYITHLLPVSRLPKYQPKSVKWLIFKSKWYTLEKKIGKKRDTSQRTTFWQYFWMSAEILCLFVFLFLYSLLVSNSRCLICFISVTFSWCVAYFFQLYDLEYSSMTSTWILTFKWIVYLAFVIFFHYFHFSFSVLKISLLGLFYFLFFLSFFSSLMLFLLMFIIDS